MAGDCGLVFTGTARQGQGSLALMRAPMIERFREERSHCRGQFKMGICCYVYRGSVNSDPATKSSAAE